VIGRRLLTVAVLLPVLLATLWLGQWAWLGLMAAVMAVGVHEAADLYGRVELPVSVAWAWPAGALAFAPGVLVAFHYLPAIAVGLGPLLALVLSLVAFLLAPGERPYRAFVGLMAAALYPAWLLAFLVLLRQAPHGLGTTFWLLAVIWLGDAAAYGAGKLVGGPHVVPGISPGKTLAGFLGGFVVAVAAAVGLAPLVGVGALAGAGLGVLVVAAAQFGDLAESLL